VKIHNIKASQKIFEFNLKDKINLDDLKIILKDYKQNNLGVEKEGFYTWHSDYYIHKKIPELNDLSATIEDLCTTYVLGELDYVINAKFVVKECILLDFPVFGSTDWHVHHPLCYTSVFYVTADDTSELCFENTEIKPESGKLLIFSGTISHRVKPRLIKHKERLVITMNLYPILDFNHNTQKK